MKRLYEAPFVIVTILLATLFVTSISASCLPCQPSKRRFTAWDTYQDIGLNLDHSPRAIFNPKFTNPTNTTVWIVGSQVIATWDTSDIPDSIENPKGTLLLGYMTDGSENEHLDLHHKLASSFDLRDGFVKFKCPKVEEGSNYIVVLFGDSGNRSPKFSILH